MKDITILVSAAGSPTMPGQIKCFRNNGERNIRIVGVDMIDDPTTKFLVDSFYQVPEADNPTYCDCLLDICKKEHVDIYFTNISAEVSAISKRKKEFDEIGTIVSMSNLKSIEIANDKLEAYKVLKKAGIPVPEFYEVKSIAEFKHACLALGYPQNSVCLKIVNSSGSRGVRIIDAKKSRYQIFAHGKPNSFYTSYEDMISILEEAENLDKMMLIPYFPGNEYTVDLLAENGNVLYMVGRENVVSMMSIAQQSILASNDIAYRISKEIVKELQMTGNIGIDFIKDANGNPVLMDINPRITATVSIIAAGGVNLPYLRVKQLLHEKMPECAVEYGVMLKRTYLETFCNANGEIIKF